MYTERTNDVHEMGSEMYMYLNLIRWLNLIICKMCVCWLWTITIISDKMGEPMPEIKSKHSLVAKYVTKPIWDKLHQAVTTTAGFTLAKAIACATEYDDQHCGIYAG